MVVDFLLLGIVIGILLIAGYAVTRLIPPSNGLATAGMTAVFGVALFIVMSNGFAYVTSPEGAWRVTLILLLQASLLIVAGFPKHCVEPSLIPPPWYVWSTAILAGVTGLMNARFTGSDPTAWTHFPLAAQIIAGNFPVTEAVNPFVAIGYHYGPAFLAAAFTGVAHVSLAVSYALEPLFGAVGVLLFAGALARTFTTNWKTVFLCSLVALGAMGLGWLHVVFLLRDLVSHFILGHHLAYPFKELAPIFASSYYTSSVLDFLGHRPSALGYPLLFATLFALSQVLAESIKRKQQGTWAVVTVILMSALALCMETGLVMLMAALVAFAALLILLDLLNRRSVSRSSSLFAFSSFVILGLALFIARHQGGILTTLSGDVGTNAFSVSFDGRLHFNPDGTSIALWDWHLYREFGLPLLLLPFSIVFSWRRRKTQPFLLLLCILALANYSAPFVVHFGARPHETNRLLFTALSISGFLGALMLGETWLVSAKQTKRIAAHLLIASMLVSSTVYLVFRLAFPTLRFESAPLFAGMPAITESEAAMYEWVNEHTTYADHFYMGVNLAELRPPYKPSPTDIQLPRITFMTYTGRKTIGPILYILSFPKDKLPLFDQIEADCAPETFRQLQIRYLMIDTPARAQWFQSRCTAAAWKTAYRDSSGIPRIEELAAPTAILSR